MMVLGREVDSKSIVEQLNSVDTPEGRQRVKDFLEHEPFPHYFAHPSGKGLLIREDKNGKQTAGRFVNREFVPVKRSRRLATA